MWASAMGLSGEEAFQQSVLRCKGPEGRKSTETQVAAAGERGGGGGGWTMRWDSTWGFKDRGGTLLSV